MFAQVAAESGLRAQTPLEKQAEAAEVCEPAAVGRPGARAPWSLYRVRGLPDSGTQALPRPLQIWCRLQPTLVQQFPLICRHENGDF